jgi:hypothetical protein
MRVFFRKLLRAKQIGDAAEEARRDDANLSRIIVRCLMLVPAIGSL